MRAPVFEDKVVEFIFGQADISEKEVSLDELTAEDEGDLPKANKDKPEKKKKTAAKKKSTARKSTKKSA